MARRQVGEGIEVFRAQRFGDAILLTEPFAQVHDLAAVRAERTVFSIEPFSFLLAGRAFDWVDRLHPKIVFRAKLAAGLENTKFKISAIQKCARIMKR
jgi:hypothetical protein